MMRYDAMRRALAPPGILFPDASDEQQRSAHSAIVPEYDLKEFAESFQDFADTFFNRAALAFHFHHVDFCHKKRPP